MAKVTIELPDGMDDLGSAFEQFARKVNEAMPDTSDGRAVDMAAYERTVERYAAELECEILRRGLQRLDVDAEHVTIRGERYTRVGRYEAPYRTKAGEVRVMRSIYRPDGVRNGKTVDPVSLRAGVVADAWLPNAADTMAFLVQQLTSREAEASAQRMGRLRYSRSSFERVAHEVGAFYDIQSADIEADLTAAYELPKAARSVSVGLDRVNVPMEEPRPKPVGRPRKDAPKRPIARRFRQAYVGTVTLHDEKGEALYTIRSGRMPQGDATELCARMANDVKELLRKRPGLLVQRLADGAPEMFNLLSAAINEETLGVEVHDAVDCWHTFEKLGKAASVMAPAAHAPNESPLPRWKMLLLNKSDAVPTILDELHQSGLEDRLVGEAKPVHDAITYLENNGDRMHYAQARRLGLPIGSGNTEATCKSLFEIRFKRSGSRWKDDTGQDIVNLRALALSDRWSEAVPISLSALRADVKKAA